MLVPRVVLVLVLPVAAAVASGACNGPDVNRPVQTLSGVIPRPEATGVTKHTIDNTGFIDNGGRSSEMTTRSEMSGMRATEAGGERPTGTPGSGTPVPLPESAPPQSVEEAFEGGRIPKASPRGSLPTRAGGPSIETGQRLARARCDRETACSRVGVGHPWATQESCLADQREHVSADFASLSCARGIDSIQLGACLNAMRVRPCGETGPEMDTVSECRSSALCIP
jgi:hypothetical protein